MGMHKNISISTFPKQGAQLGKPVAVNFHYDASKPIEGVVLRDDHEEPGRTIIHLDDGRVVLDTECQFQPVD